jgi:hypothetical protein
VGTAQIPKRKQKAEVLWQVLDVVVILAVICFIFALFIDNFAVSVLLCILSLASIIKYLVIEYKIEYKLVKARRIKQEKNPAMEESRANLLLWGAIIAGLAIGNFFLQFARHGVTVNDIPITAPFYKNAIALMFLTVVTCLLVHALHHSYHFSKNLGLAGIHQARTIKSYVLAFFYTFVIVYVILLLSPYDADLDFALLAGIIYLGFREFQRYDRKNHRKHIHKLHETSRNNSAP